VSAYLTAFADHHCRELEENLGRELQFYKKEFAKWLEGDLIDK
jgi:hypothetical protein